MTVRSIEVLLPGGFADGERVERRVCFKPLTGRIQRSLIESAEQRDRANYVTDVLSQVIERVGEKPLDAAMAARFSVPDRQFLMLRLAALITGERVWLKVECGHCHSLFDVEVFRSELPVKEAGEGYPGVSVKLDEMVVEAKVPTGRDQEGLGDLDDHDATLRLLQSCIESVDGQPPSEDFFGQLSKREVTLIDEALDEMAPAVCDRLVSNCPECQQQQIVPLDHSGSIEVDEYAFYDEIHTLASAYHWSESDILDLPLATRQRYLDLIHRSTSG